MDWSDFGGMALGGALDFANSAFSSSQSSKAVKRMIAWQREQYQNKYQWTVDDMRKAGLNPMLAIKNGASSVTGINAPMATSDFGRNLGRIAEYELAKANVASAKENVNLLKDQQTNTQAQAYKAWIDAETSKKLGLLYSANALQATESARSTRMINDFLHNHPGVLSDQQINKGGSGIMGQIKQFFGLLGNVFGPSRNSAK